MEPNTSDLKKVEAYIRGNLEQDQIEKLWMCFLKKPELFSYFTTELHLRAMIRDVAEGRISSPFKD